MKIGIFLAYAPQVRLGQEGLGRYLAGLVKGFSEKGQQIVVVTPKWSLDTLTSLFRDFGIRSETVSFAVLDRPPVFWGILSLLGVFKRKKIRTKNYYHILQTSIDVLEKVVGMLVRITNVFLFVVMLMISLICACVLLPVALAAAVLMLIAYGTKTLIRKKKPTLKAIYAKFQKGTAFLSATGVSFDRYIYGKLSDATASALVKKANRQDVDIWFVPALFWPETRGLKQIRAITAPDLVTEAFPYVCADYPGFAPSAEKCRATIQTGEHFITYCDYIRKTLLVDGYGKTDVRVIPHPINSTSENIQIATQYSIQRNEKRDLTEIFARQKLNRLWDSAVYWKNLYEGATLENVKYIFYASQARPYKNILNLLRAYRELVNKRYINVKLVLTCNLSVIPELYHYVEQYGMQPDVIALHGVDGQGLAALYRCAELVVNPTLYEGGFPFTFAEGMSVGTPSVMSDIPQVRDVIEPYGLAEEMLFDPNDVQAIADKIEYGLMHKAELYQKELPVFNAMACRTENVVAQEYLESFQTIINTETRKIK